MTGCTDDAEQEHVKLRDCQKCRRPRRVCLCAALPEDLIALHGKLVILQHPYECRRRMSTVPLLSLCVQDMVVLRGRRFHESQELQSLLHEAELHGQSVILLFLGNQAVDIRGVGDCHSDGAAKAQRPSEAAVARHGRYLLLVIDGTWCQAKEMYKELQSWLPAFVQLAHLPFDGRKEDSVVQDYLVRSQPAPACLSTMEAVARALAIMEGNPQIEELLLRPLRLMTSLQAEFDPSTQTRLHQGTAVHTNGKSYGFKIPASLQS